ncbi:MAG: radical SAM protein [Isosphaeraceae bacterium]
MIALPVLDQASVAESPPVATRDQPAGNDLLEQPPWLHLLPGDRPLAFLVRDSQLFEVDRDTFERLQGGDETALLHLQALEPSPRVLALDDVTPPQMPAAISLNIAQTCNLACSYCYADEGRFQGQPRIMSESVALRAVGNLLDRAEPGSRVTVGFIGGEPFLNRRVLYRAVEYARERAAQRRVTVGFSVTTNGTLLEPEDLRFLRENLFAVSVSLDGDEQTHNRHRHGRDGAGSWRQILTRLGPLLNDPGPVKLAARATITRDDLRVAERVAALVEAGFREVGVSPARTGPVPELLLRGDDWGVYLGEMVRAADAEMARVRDAGAQNGWRFSNLGIALKEIHEGACRPLPCGAAYGYVSVNAEGHYYTCHRTLDDPRFKLGGTDGPEFSARLRFLDGRHVDRQVPCRSCWARYLCGGGCHAEVVSAGRDGCEMIRGWLEHCLRLYNTVIDEFPVLLTRSREYCLS